MKRFNFMRILSLLIVVLAVQVQAQHPFLSRLTASVVGEGVYLEWTVNQGSTCAGITIERAGPDKIYAEVGRIKEVCGSIEEPIDYNYLDEAPVAGELSYYRLILGLDGTTDPVTVEYVEVDAAGFSVSIDEQSDLITVFSLRPFEQNNSLVIYDVRGAELERVSLSDNTYSQDLAQFDAGILLVAILEDNEVIYFKRVLKSN